MRDQTDSTRHTRADAVQSPFGIETEDRRRALPHASQGFACLGAVDKASLYWFGPPGRLGRWERRAARRRSGVRGISVMRTPMASSRALPMAAGTATHGVSPTPLAPKG